MKLSSLFYEKVHKICNFFKGKGNDSKKIVGFFQKALEIFCIIVYNQK